MVWPFLSGIFAVVMMLVGNTLYALLDQILKSHIPFVIVARLVVFNIPELIVLTLPVGIALSSSLAVNRLSRDSELTPLRMTGTPLHRIFRSIYIAGALVSIFSFWMGEVVVPRASVEKQRTEGAMLGFALTALPTLISNQVFTYGNYSFFVREVTQGAPGKPNARLAKDIMIYENPVGEAGFPQFLTAKSAVYDDGNWLLSGVIYHKLADSGFTTVEVRGGSGVVDIRAPMPKIANPGSGFAGLDEQETMAQLAQDIEQGNRTGLDTTEAQVDFQFKMSLPILCLAFALCAPSLAIRFARTGPFMGVFLSIIMVFVGWNTLLLTKALGITEHISPVMAAWSPDLLFATVGLLLLWRSE